MLKIRFLLLGVLFLFLGCSPEESSEQSSQNTQEILRVGFIPSENMTEIQRNAQPLVEMMSQAIGVEIKPFIATDYTGIVEAFRNGKLDVAFLSPASYVMAHSEAGVKVLLKAQRGEAPFYHSVIFTRTDSGIHNVQDLKGKTFAFGDTLSTAGSIYPQKILRDNEIDPSTDFENLIFSGGHDATVLAVFNQKVQAGATYANKSDGSEPAWDHLLKPEESKQLKVIAVSDPIPSDNICVSKTLSAERADAVKKFFSELTQTEEGKNLVQKLYRIDKFVPATDKDYTGIRDAFRQSGIELKAG